MTRGHFVRWLREHVILLHWHRWINDRFQGDEGYLHQHCRCGLTRTIDDPEWRRS